MSSWSCLIANIKESVDAERVRSTFAPGTETPKVTQNFASITTRDQDTGNQKLVVNLACWVKIVRASDGKIISTLEMWANAQRDGRPAEYRWRPLFNAAKFGWRLLLECRAVTLPRRANPLKFAGVPQSRQQISAVSRPKFTILSRHVEEILLFNKFFSDCRYMP